jgi:hypothetical protein
MIVSTVVEEVATNCNVLSFKTRCCGTDISKRVGNIYNPLNAMESRQNRVPNMEGSVSSLNEVEVLNKFEPSDQAN